MRIVRGVLALMAAGAVAACATSGTAGPEATARLERARAANPTSEPVLRSLGISYYRSGKLPDARGALDQAVKLNPRDGTAALYLGLTAESQNDIPAARAAYGSYVQYGRTSRVRRALEARLAALQRRELEQTAKADVAREATLASQAGSPNVVAVLPLRFSGTDSSLAPLGRGLAELLTTDLARSSRLTVVERMRIQAVLDELRLKEAGLTDSSSGVRSGRILQAGRLVQGAILQQAPQAIRVDAAVVDVPTTRVAGATNDARALDDLLTLEKNLALGLFQQLGVTLTTAERNAVEQRPTRSLAAFLSYSRGLLAEDDGRLEDANRAYLEAVRLDPGFTGAQQKSQQTQDIIAGNQLTTASIESGLDGTAEGRIVEQAVAGIVTGSEGGTALATAADLNPSAAGAAASNASGAMIAPNRDPAATGLDLENPGDRTGRIQIIVRRP